jgi:hypothetical protein
MRINISCLAYLVFVTAARSGWAQPSRLVVERSAGAEQCPDAAALSARIEQIRGRADHELVNGYRVLFTRREDVFTAVISTGPNGVNVRVLENTGPNCSALGNATAVTLALLFDSDVKERPPPPSLPAPAVVVETPSAPVERPPPPRYVTLALGAVGFAGVLRPVSPGVIADSGMAGPNWRMSIGALWAFPQTIPLGSGSVREQWLGGFSRACLAPWAGASIRFDICSGAVFALVTAEGLGYSRNERRTEPWVAVPLELALASYRAPFGWELGAGALAPLRRRDFSIDGLGVAYHSPPVAGILTLRAVGILPF